MSLFQTVDVKKNGWNKGLGRHTLGLPHRVGDAIVHDFGALGFVRAFSMHWGAHFFAWTGGASPYVKPLRPVILRRKFGFTCRFGTCGSDKDRHFVSRSFYSVDK